jgi:hypothetical protein
MIVRSKANIVLFKAMSQSSLPKQRENVTIRMNPDLKEQLQIKAIKERCHLSDLIEQAALLYLEQQKPA